MTTNPPDLTQIAIADAMVCEKALLGGILLDLTILPLVSGKLDPADFQSPDHREIYKAILEIHNFGIDPDYVSVFEYVRRLEFSYYIELHSFALPGSVDYLVRRIKESARRRAAQFSMMESIKSLGSPDVDLAAQWEYLSSDFLKLLREESGIITVGDQLLATMKRIDSQDESAFIKIGLREIDATTGGAQRGESWVIAGRPSMGKSSLAATCTLNMARAGYAVTYIPVEGTSHSLMCRLLSIFTGIDLQRIRTGKLEPQDYPRIAHATGIISSLKLFIIEETRWAKIRAHVQALKLREPELAAVFIDYLGLIEVSRNHREREREVAFLSADIKRLAKDLDVVCFPLVQLNREVEKRKDHRPVISDLRESGSLEQDADVILFPYRPSYYGEKVDFPTDAEVAIAKNRDGRTGTAEVRFEAEYVRFSERGG